jgi:hypothetical protein
MFRYTSQKLYHIHMHWWTTGHIKLFVCLMVFNATFNDILVISWRRVILVEETGGPRENQRPFASHWQALSHNSVHLVLIEIRTHNISGDGTDCIYSCKSNYHTIMATTALPAECDIPVFYNLMKISVRLVPTDNSRKKNWRTYNTMANRKRTIGQTTIFKTLLRKLNTH